MLTVLYPHLLPAIRDYPAGLMPIVLEGADYPMLVIKGMKEAILAARLNRNFKIYVVPATSGGRHSIGLITAFFDIPDEPLIIRSQLFLDEDFSRKLLVLLLSDRLDVHFFDEHAREQIAYRADVLMTPEARRVIMAAEFADEYHTDWRQMDDQLQSWFSNRTEEDDRTAIEVRLVEPLMPDDIAYIDATSGGNAYAGSPAVNVSYLVRNEPGLQQEHDIALLLQRVFPAEQIFRGALRDYDREEIADLLIVTERSLIFIQAKDSPNTESVIRNTLERKKATALKSLKKALGQLRGAVRYSKRASPMVILVDGREATVDVSVRSLYCIALVKELFNEDYQHYSSPVLQLASETKVPCVALDYAELNMYTANLRDEQSFLLAIERVFEVGHTSGMLPRLRVGPDREFARSNLMSTDNDNSAPTQSMEGVTPISLSGPLREEMPDGEEGRADSVPPQGTRTLPALKLRPMLCEARAPECAALLAALNIDFAVAAKNFNACAPTEKKADVPSRRGEAMPIEVARRLFLQRAQLPGRKPRRNSRDFIAIWTLRLYDVEWFKAHCATFSSYSVPSIREDRQHLRELNADENISPALRRRMLKERSCYIRAGLRDKQWLDRHLCLLREELEDRKQTDTAIEITDRVRRVQEALTTLASSSARPEGPTLRRLARITGLSAGQIRKALYSSPDLRAAVDDVKDKKVALQLKWATQELIKNGVALTKNAILRKARMAAKPKARRIAQQLAQAGRIIHHNDG